MAKSTIFIDGNQAGLTLKGIKNEVRLLNKEIADLVPGSDAYNKKVSELAKKNQLFKEHRKNINGINESYGQAKQGVTSLMKQFAPAALAIGLVGAAIGGVSSAIGSWYENNVKFEKSMSSLKSLTGLGEEGMAKLREESIRMGRETTQSASDVITAMKDIGSQRPELLKNADALATVTEKSIVLTEAGEISMNRSASAVTSAMNQLELGADQADRIINAYAAGSQAGAATIENIADTFDKSGAVMKDYNVSLEEGIGLTETLAEKNIKGTEAGTALLNVLLKMETFNGVPDDALARLEAMGINIDLIKDKSIPLNERLEEMKKVTSDVSLTAKVFGTENVVAAKAILDNTDKVQKYTEAVTGTNTAYVQQAINNDNMEGDLKSLGSAWEGLTLTIGDGGAFRPLVQTGTDFLNWMTDTITAVQEFDMESLTTQALKAMNAFSGWIPVLGDMLDRMIQVREMSAGIVDSISDRATSATVLTRTLAETNAALKDSSLTEEENIKLKTDQAELIDKLKEQYPDLTEEIDLQNASSQTLNGLQKEINENLIENAINSAKAAEMQRLIGEIIREQVELNMMISEYERAGPLEKAFLAKSVLAQKEKVDGLNKALKETPDTMKMVEKAVKGMDIDFGVEFDVNTELIVKSNKELKKIQQELKKTDLTQGQQAALKAMQKAEQETIKIAEKRIKEMKDAALEKQAEEDAAAKAADDAAKAADLMNKKQEEASKKAADAYKKQQEALDKLMESAEKYASDFNFDQRLKAFEDEQQKELFVTENTINEKYAKDIESAQELSKAKGKLGVEAQEQLSALIALKDQELNASRLEINQRYLEEKQAQEYENQKNSNLRHLEQQRSLEESIIDLKVASAQIAVEDAAKLNLNAQKEVQKQLEDALTAQAELEKKRRLESLMDQESEMQISRDEYNTRKEQLELEHLQKIEEIHAASGDRIKQMDLDRLNQVFENISNVVGIINDFADSASQQRLNDINEQEQAEIDSLQKQFFQKSISEEEYGKLRTEIEQKADRERKVIERDQAKRAKELALFEIAINTAVAVSKVAGIPPAILLALATGAAQAAIVAARPLPQLMDGGYTDVIGAQDGKGYRAKNIGRPSAGLTGSSPSLALINEKGPEYFVPNHLLRNQRVMNYVGAIEAIRTNQYAEGGFTGNVSGGDGDLTKLIAANLQMMSKIDRSLQNLRVKFDDDSIEELDDRRDDLNSFVA